MNGRGPVERLRIVMRDASRSGVPVALERYLGWLRTQTDTSVDLVLRFGGPLIDRFEPITDTLTVLEPSGPSRAASVLRLAGRPRAAAAIEDRLWRSAVRRLPPPDVSVLHGAGAWPLRATIPTGCTVVGHLHELELGTERAWTIPGRDELLRPFDGIDALMVVDPSITSALGRRGWTPPAAIVPGCVNVGVDIGNHTGTGSDRVNDQDAHRTVIGIGDPGWRKGVDRFVAMAWELTRRRPDTRCVWIGGRPAGRDAFAVSTAVARGEVVEWISPTAEPWSVVARPDVLVVCSREDPLPLVALEAATRRVPIVTAAPGGLEQLVTAERGYPVHPNVPISGLTDAVTRVLDDPRDAAERAERARSHVVRAFDIETVGTGWWDTIRTAGEATGGQ